MYARVAVARPLPQELSELTYAVPASLGELALGHVVLVPLGSVGETGYVISRSDSADGLDPDKIKPVSRLLDPLPAFDETQLAFFRWIADYYLAPLGLVIHTALPSGIRAKVIRSLVPSEAGILALTRREVENPPAQVLREVIARPGLTRKGLRRRLAAELDAGEVDKGIDALVRWQFADWADKEVGEQKGTVRTVSRVADAPPPARKPGPKMQEVLAALGDGPVDLPRLVASFGDGARSAVKSLEGQGLVVTGEREARDLLAHAPPLGSPEPPPLNADQRAALDVLCAPDATGSYVLFGVTGSGKTEVFLGAARAALDRGRQVLVLVPEIGLTPQLVGRFRARFGDRVAVLHSGLTGGERLAEWRRIRAREADVAVGARSALFAPFAELGLIVVDEEHDDSYKQDDGVPYHARDLAVKLGHDRGCPVVLASATPSLESWYNALQGRYRLLRLPRRATAKPVPVIELVDLSDQAVGEGDARPLLAPVVEQALRDAFERGGQAIVLYNRRGYATLVECLDCGATYECPNCAISMTLHKRVEKVTCHYCGLRLPYTGSCPVCRSTHLDEEGKGTERIEETLKELFPSISIGRMDADTTAERGAHHRILDAFRDGKTQMLVGTQIVAKGHDFPGVHVAVVVSADKGFRMPDFRASERTAALIVQLAGRAGRGSVPGRVLVQTWRPDHYVLQHLHDLEGFYDTELRLRQTMKYPPFTRLVLLRFDGVDRATVLGIAEATAKELRRRARTTPSIGLLGPAPAALPRLVGRWRFQVVVRGDRIGALRAFLADVRPVLEKAGKKGVRVGWDVDPRHIM